MSTTISQRLGRRLCLAALTTAALVAHVPAFAQDAPRRETGPWDVKAILDTTPKAEWGAVSDGVREVYYEGETLGGKPTRIFGYYATPEASKAPAPAMLLVHGGGGKAFRQWAELWAKRGYIALAMDLSGRGPDGKRLHDGGPEQDDDTKFRDFDDAHVRDMWTYHAVAAVLRGHALLASRPEVDRDKVGVTGISWGGYLTCIVAGIDHRLKVAVPVYGCGYLDEDSCWLPRFNAMTPERRARWVENFDPSRYLPGVACPILFVNGTNDFAYPLGSYRKSYRLVRPELRTLRVTVAMPHGHEQGWAPQEIGLFVDSVIKGGPPLPSVKRLQFSEAGAHSAIDSQKLAVLPKVHFTTDTGPWQARKWTTRNAELSGGRIDIRNLPDARPLGFFVTVTDDRGAVVSSDHVELPADATK